MKKISFLLLAGWVFALNGDELAQQMDEQKKPTDSKVDLQMTFFQDNKQNQLKIISRYNKCLYLLQN